MDRVQIDRTNSEEASHDTPLVSPLIQQQDHHLTIIIEIHEQSSYSTEVH
jgi:hypothetical protein